MAEHELLLEVLGVLHLDKLLYVSRGVPDALVHILILRPLRVEERRSLQHFHVLVVGLDRRLGIERERLAGSGNLNLDREDRLLPVDIVRYSQPFITLECVPLDLVWRRKLNNNLFWHDLI